MLEGCPRPSLRDFQLHITKAAPFRKYHPFLTSMIVTFPSPMLDLVHPSEATLVTVLLATLLSPLQPLEETLFHQISSNLF